MALRERGSRPGGPGYRHVGRDPHGDTSFLLADLRDSDDPYGLVRTLVDALPPGSFLAVSHPTADFNAGEMADAVAAATHAGVTLVPRTPPSAESGDLPGLPGP